MNEEFRMIAQNYLGMKPTDKGCKTWGEMQQKMANELEDVVKNSLVELDVKENDNNIKISEGNSVEEYCEYINYLNNRLQNWRISFNYFDEWKKRKNFI